MKEQGSRIIHASGAASIAHPHGALSRRDFMVLSGAAAASTLLPGCGGGGGVQEDFFTSRNVVVKPNVVVLPSDGTVTLSSVTDTSVTLTGTVPTLLPGAVVVSGEGAGFMRRVTSVTPIGTGVVLATEGATLTDVFESAQVSFRRTLSALDPGTTQILLEGVEVTPQGRGRDVVSSFHTHLPKTFFGAEEGSNPIFPAPPPTTNVSGGIELQADGAISTILGGDIEIVAGGIKKIEMRLAKGWAGAFKASIRGQVRFRKEFPYFVRIYTPIPLGSIGPVPIILLPVLSVQVLMSVALASGWEISGTGQAQFGSVARLRPPTPTFTPVLADFSASGNGSATGTFSGPSFFTSVKAEICPWEIELNTSFNALVGPTFKYNLPVAVLELKSFPSILDPKFAQADATIDLSVRAKVGAKAGLLGLKLPALPGEVGTSFPLFEATVAEKKFRVFKRTFKPGTSSVGVN